MTGYRAGRYLPEPAEAAPGSNLAPVSVVVPCFNASSTILRAVASIAAQTMHPVETVIVDDASTDGSSELVESFARDWPTGRLILIQRSANEGPSAARNAGWERASQPWVAFLDADDAWHPRKLEICLGAADRVRGRVDLIGHRCPPGARAAWQPVPEDFRLRYPIGREALWRNILPTSSVVLRRDLPYRFEPARRRSEDYLLWMMVIMTGGRALWLDLPLAQAFKPLYGAGGLSGDLWAMEVGELATYQRLAADGLVSPGEGLILQLWSLAKFVRRCLITRVRTRSGSDAPDGGWLP